MPKFFINENQIENDTITITGDDVNHIKNVLRLQIDDDINICDFETKNNYICGIYEINKEYIKCKILKEIVSNSESNISITIFQGLPKADKMELIIQKSIELGVDEITPVQMERCIVKLDEKTKNKKIERWQKIAEIAAKQCGRDIIPKINYISNIETICNFIPNYDIVLLAYEKEELNSLKSELRKLSKGSLKIGIIIGPEGGLEKAEVEELKQNGAKTITLGNRILRTETVAFVMSSIIMYELGDLGGINNEERSSK